MEPILHSLLKLFVARISKRRFLCIFDGAKAFVLEQTYTPFNIYQKLGFTVEQKELKRMAAVLQELGLSYTETLEVVNEMAKDVNNAKKLWRDGHKSKLIKLAITLITFPEPTPISETMGAAVLVAGLIQNRIKKSTLHIEDVYKTFQDVNNDILKIRQFRT
jgi:hypothetical protein